MSGPRTGVSNSSPLARKCSSRTAAVPTSGGAPDGEGVVGADERAQDRRLEQFPLGEEMQFANGGGADERRVPERDVVRGHDHGARRRDVLASADLPAAQDTHEAPEQEAGRTIVQAQDLSKSYSDSDLPARPGRLALREAVPPQGPGAILGAPRRPCGAAPVRAAPAGNPRLESVPDFMLSALGPRGGRAGVARSPRGRGAPEGRRPT